MLKKLIYFVIAVRLAKLVYTYKEWFENIPTLSKESVLLLPCSVHPFVCLPVRFVPFYFLKLLLHIINKQTDLYEFDLESPGVL